jgi:hypothetical protein
MAIRSRIDIVPFAATGHCSMANARYGLGAGGRRKPKGGHPE